MVFQRLLPRHEKIPFERDRGCKMGLRVWDGEDVLIGSLDRSSVKMDL